MGELREGETAISGISYRGIQAVAYFSVRVARQMEKIGEAGTFGAHVMAPWWAL